VIQVDKKTIYIIVAILAVVIVAVAAVTFLMNNETETTPAPEPQTIADGDSLQFKVADSTTGLDYYCAINDFNGEADIVRVDMVMDDACYSYILNLEDSTSYASKDFGETWTKSKFADDELYLEMAYCFATELKDKWDGLSATYSYTADDISYTISDIKVNDLDDSLFATS
jgi:hypothetical protein